jgi:hypothetical protein
MKAQEARWGCVVNAILRPLYSWKRDPVPTVQETNVIKNLICPENVNIDFN